MNTTSFPLFSNNFFFYYCLLRLYSLLSFFASPFVALFIIYRRQQYLEDKTRFIERFGHSSCKRPHTADRIIWFHAASVGEALSLRNFLKKWKKFFPNDFLLVTTTTVTAAHIVQTQYSHFATHQFIPFDCYPWVSRFLEHWRPDKAFFLESEIWPNFFYLTHLKKIPITLLNARISKRSFKRWQIFAPFLRYLLTFVETCYAQNHETQERLRFFSAPNVKYFGNLKFGCDPLKTDEALQKKMSKLIKNRPNYVLASTHHGEEERLFAMHRLLLSHSPHTIVFIAPRHPERAKVVLAYAKKFNLNGILLSQIEQDLDSCQFNENLVIIIDRIGVLGTFYALTQAVLIGGSFIAHGGHNPIEPACFGKPTYYGPHMFNFNDICNVLEKSGACCLKHENEFIDTFMKLGQNPLYSLELGRSLKEAVMKEQEALDNLFNDCSGIHS